MNKFEFPSIYNFPPFFTKQPNKNTYQAQLEQWKEIILGYCKANKIWIISSNGNPLKEGEEQEVEDGEEVDNDDNYIIDNNISNQANVFKNEKIQRNCNIEFIKEIFQSLLNDKMIEYVNLKNDNEGYFLYWYKIEEWAQKIYDWIDNSGQNGNILTIYEIRRGELSINQEFYNMPYKMLIKVLRILENQKKVYLMKDDDNGIISGVKFL
jgi:ESCRT-II complex subunit VPS25